MRLRLACAVSLIAVGGAINNVLSPACWNVSVGSRPADGSRSCSLRSCQGPRAGVGASWRFEWFRVRLATNFGCE